ncbi:unnamed protein product, partial [marine sediment metagenome]
HRKLVGKVNYESNFNEKFIEISENLGISRFNS